MNFKKLEKYAILVLVVILVLLLVGCSSSKSNDVKKVLTYKVNFIVKGEVVDSEDIVEVANARIEFEGKEKFTNEKGVVVFEGIKAGEWNYKITADEYEPEEGKVVVENKDVYKEIQLSLVEIDPDYNEISLDNVVDRFMRVNNIDLNTVTKDIILPENISIDGEEYTLIWESNNIDVINNDGKVTQPFSSEGEKNVILTVTVNETGDVFEIEVTVSPLEFDKGEPGIRLTIDKEELMLLSHNANESATVTAELINFPKDVEVTVEFSADNGGLSNKVTQGKVTTITYIPNDSVDSLTATIIATTKSVKNPITGDLLPEYDNISASMRVNLIVPDAGDERSQEYINYYSEIFSATATEVDRVYVAFSGLEEIDANVLELLKPEDFTVWDNVYKGSVAEIAVEQVITDSTQKNRVILLLDGPDNNIVNGEGDSYCPNFPLTDNTTHMVELANTVEHIIPADPDDEDGKNYRITFRESQAFFKLEDVINLKITAVYNSEQPEAQKYNLAKDEIVVIFNSAPNAMNDHKYSIFNLHNWAIDGLNIATDLPGHHKSMKHVKDEPFVDMRLVSTDGDDPTTGINKDAVIIKFTDNYGPYGEPRWGLNRREFLTNAKKHTLAITNIGDWASVSDKKNIVQSQRVEYEGIEIQEVEVALIRDNSTEQFILAFNEPVNVDVADIELHLNVDSEDETEIDIVTYEDEEGNPQFRLTSLVENQVFLFEMELDWSVYHGRHGGNYTYHSESKNPIQVKVNNMVDFWGDDTIVIESNELVLKEDRQSPDSLYMKELTTIRGVHEIIDLSSIPVNINFDIDPEKKFINRAEIEFDIELNAVEELFSPEYNANTYDRTNIIADAGAVLILMNEPMQWIDKNYKNDDGIPYTSSSTVTPPLGADNINNSTFTYTLVYDQDDNYVDGDVVIDGFIAEVSTRDYYVLVNPAKELTPGVWRFTHRDSRDAENNAAHTKDIEFRVTDGVLEPVEEIQLPFRLLAVDMQRDTTGWLEEIKTDIVHVLFTHDLMLTGTNSALEKGNYRINGLRLPEEGTSILTGIRGDDRYIGVISHELVEGSGFYEEKIMIISQEEFELLSEKKQNEFEPIRSSRRAVTIILPDNYLLDNNMLTISNVANSEGEIHKEVREDISFGVEYIRLDSIDGNESVTGDCLLFAPYSFPYGGYEHYEVEYRIDPFGYMD